MPEFTSGSKADFHKDVMIAGAKDSKGKSQGGAPGDTLTPECEAIFASGVTEVFCQLVPLKWEDPEAVFGGQVRAVTMRTTRCSPGGTATCSSSSDSPTSP